MSTSTWTQPSMPLTTNEATDVDDIDNHLIDCACDECIDMLVAQLQEHGS